MKKILLAIITSCVLFSNCKKKEESLTTTTPSSNVDPNTFVGVFITSTYTNNLGGSTKINQGATGRFYSQPSSNIYQINEKTIAKLSVNNDTLTKIGFPTYVLISPTSTVNLSVDSWSVTGGDGIPSFNYTNNNAFPSCSDFNVMADSISKSTSYTIAINNISNMTWGIFLFNDGVSHQFTYTLSPGTNTFAITPSQLSAMSTGTTGYFDIQMQNSATIVASGQNFRFIKEAQIIKRLKINP